MAKTAGKMGPAMAAIFTRYELYAGAAGFSPAHIDDMRNSVRYFDQFLGVIRDPAAVTADDFRRYLVYLPTKPVWKGLKNEQARLLSGTSVNTYAREVQTFFKWLADEKIIPTDPMAAVRIPRKPKTLPKIYSEQDLIAVIRAAETSLRDNAIFSLFIDSGIRLEELEGIRIGNLDIAEGWVRVMGKGRKERIVPFQTAAANCLSLYIEAERKHAGKDEPLFLTDDGHPLSKRGVQALMWRLGKNAGIKERLSPHKLRHSFATLGAKWGANLEQLRIILGHADISTTSGSYLNVQNADLKDAHARFSPLAHLKQIAAGEHSDVPDKNQKAVPSKPKSSPEATPVSENSASNGLISGQPPNDKKQIQSGTGEAGVSDIAGAVRLAAYQRLYDEHSRKLTALVILLMDDIKAGRVETDIKTKAKANGMFGNLGMVYPSQKQQLWSSLKRHLDNEFNNPPLSKQIREIANFIYWGLIFKSESNNKMLTNEIIEKLVILSERGFFKGTCDLCEGYSLQDSHKP
jgi:site-specific recombinase XerD